MNITNFELIKSIKYRLSYSGTKETDILYKKIILKKLNILEEKELLLLSNLLIEISDIDIFNILTNQTKKPKIYKDLINKILDE